MCSSVARASEKESPSFSYGENVNRIESARSIGVGHER